MDPLLHAVRRAFEARSLIGPAVLLLAVFAVFTFHLDSVLISDMDEGTYVYAGALIARGLAPYRDFMMAHPPLIAFLVAGWAHAFGPALVPLRFAYIAVVLGSTLPLYALVRRITPSSIAPVLSIVVYTSGMLLLANMGRTVRLEPLMNAFVIAGVACRFVRPRSWPWAAAMGAFFACALLVKVIALVPIGLLVLSDVAWERPWGSWAFRWLVAGAGALVVLGPTMAWCFAQPLFAQDVFFGQVHRPGIGLGTRLHYLGQNFVRYPPVLLGLAAAAAFLARRVDSGIRSVAVLALGSTLVLVFAFKTFFNYYIVQALPWIAVSFAIALDIVMDRALGKRWVPIAVTSVLLLGLGVPLAYAEVYERAGSFHVAGPRRILPLIRDRTGYIYSMYPAFALWSGRELYPWYYRTDSLVARINGWVGDADFQNVFEGSSTLVLFAGETDDYPLARHYAETHFDRAYEDHDWSVWVRAGER